MTSHSTGKWIETTARAGYAAKGVVYLALGILAAVAATSAKSYTGTDGALASIARQPYGTVALILVAAGLACYAVWRGVQAVADPESAKDGPKRWVARAYFAISGLVHVGLVFAAIQILASGQSTGDNGPQERSATLLAQPFGQLLLTLAGIAVLGAAVYQFVRAYRARFTERMRFDVGVTAKGWLVRLGRTGLAARGVVFATIGVFLVVAAMNSDAGAARGVAGALRALENGPFGTPVLLAVALGLAAYGAHQISKSRFRVIEPR